jgi:hypothetical protein
LHLQWQNHSLSTVVDKLRHKETKEGKVKESWRQSEWSCDTRQLMGGPLICFEWVIERTHEPVLDMQKMFRSQRKIIGRSKQSFGVSRTAEKSDFTRLAISIMNRNRGTIDSKRETAAYLVTKLALLRKTNTLRESLLRETLGVIPSFWGKLR